MSLNVKVNAIYMFSALTFGIATEKEISLGSALCLDEFPTMVAIYLLR